MEGNIAVRLECTYAEAADLCRVFAQHLLDPESQGPPPDPGLGQAIPCSSDDLPLAPHIPLGGSGAGGRPQ